MMKQSNQDTLLQDVLNETTSPEFREELFQTTVRSAQRKRQLRRARNLVLVVVLSLLTVTLPSRRTRVITTAAPPQSSVTIISSRPIAPEMIVASRPQSVMIVETKARKTLIDEIADEELLTLVPGELKFLVWRAPHRAELIVLGEDDTAY
jgi:hypothetical protein